MNALAHVADWLLTFALHSSVALSVALLVACAMRQRALPFQELLLRLALLLPLPSSLLQCACQWSPVAFSMPVVVGVDLPLPRWHWSEPNHAASGAAFPTPGAPATAPTSPAWNAPVGTDLRPWLTILAASAALLGLLALCRSYARLRTFLADREPEQDLRVLGLAAELAQRAGLRQTPHLSRSVRLSTPVAMGLWRPEICLPLAASQLDTPSLRALLAHELAHLRRADPLWLCLQALSQALFPWQPLWLVWRRRWTMLSELQCDAAAVHSTSPTAVARCLLEVAGWMQAGRQPLLLASGMAARPSTLRLRIEAALAAGEPLALPRGLQPVAALVSSLALVFGVPAVVGAPQAETASRPAVAAPAAVATAPAAPTAPTATPAWTPARTSVTEAAAVSAEFAALAAEVASLRRAYAGRRPDPKIERALALLSQRLLVLEQLHARLEAALQR